MVSGHTVIFIICRPFLFCHYPFGDLCVMLIFLMFLLRQLFVLMRVFCVHHLIIFVLHYKSCNIWSNKFCLSLSLISVLVFICMPKTVQPTDVMSCNLASIHITLTFVLITILKFIFVSTGSSQSWRGLVTNWRHVSAFDHITNLRRLHTKIAIQKSILSVISKSPRISCIT